jgi:hypothetical protein
VRLSVRTVGQRRLYVGGYGGVAAVVRPRWTLDADVVAGRNVSAEQRPDQEQENGDKHNPASWTTPFATVARSKFLGDIGLVIKFLVGQVERVIPGGFAPAGIVAGSATRTGARVGWHIIAADRAGAGWFEPFRHREGA